MAAYYGECIMVGEAKLYSILNIKNELFAWYKWQKETQKTAKLYELQDLRPEMLTGSVEQPSLGTKAAECKTLFFHPWFGE